MITKERVERERVIEREMFLIIFVMSGVCERALITSDIAKTKSCASPLKARERERERKPYLEASGQGIVLNGEFDFFARSKQFHDGLLMCCTCHIAAINSKYAIAHSQLATLCSDSAGNNLLWE
jgi:hypothetical protein